MLTFVLPVSRLSLDLGVDVFVVNSVAIATTSTMRLHSLLRE